MLIMIRIKHSSIDKTQLIEVYRIGRLIGIIVKVEERKRNKVYLIIDFLPMWIIRK